jgi:hypothetical protein
MRHRLARPLLYYYLQTNSALHVLPHCLVEHLWRSFRRHTSRPPRSHLLPESATLLLVHHLNTFGISVALFCKFSASSADFQAAISLSSQFVMSRTCRACQEAPLRPSGPPDLCPRNITLPLTFGGSPFIRFDMCLCPQQESSNLAMLMLTLCMCVLLGAVHFVPCELCLEATVGSNPSPSG